jgi:8-oxo-dGTP pyrophosphatase MutT (NUDIX family)
MAQPSLGAFAKYASLVNNLTRILGEFSTTRKVLVPRTPTVRQAAVMCPLVIRNDEVHVLFTLRSGQVWTHKNQVSFPGGHLDTVDGQRETATHAAVRECKEELGDALDVMPLGLYHDAFASEWPCSPLPVSCLLRMHAQRTRLILYILMSCSYWNHSNTRDWRVHGGPKRLERADAQHNGGGQRVFAVSATPRQPVQ